MYTSYIGKKFLKLYNEKYNKDYSAEEFFNTVIFPLFFNDDRHFFNVANSSFFQKVSQKLNDGKSSIHEIKLKRFHKNVKEDGASLTTMVGYAAQDIMAGTSGQLSSANWNISNDEMYSSWIGAGLSVGMGGGFSILFDNDYILKLLFIGWEFYRKVLSQTPNLKGNQIDTWNAHWLCHALSNKYDKNNPFNNFLLPNLKPCIEGKLKKKGYVEFEGNKWANTIFAISKKNPDQIMTVNSYKFGKMNTTLGFINLFLPNVRKFYEFRDKLFINEDDTILSDIEIDNLSTFYSFSEACKIGSIGLSSLEPAKLRQYMPKGSVKYAQGKDFKFNNEESYKQYQLFKIWIIAMINKEQLLNAAENIAGILVDTEKKQEQAESRGKTKASQASKEFLEIKHLKGFVEGLALLLEKSENKEKLKECLNEVIKMPSDSFPLFMALIKFEYSYKTK
jgi:hypothetical protein